MAYIKSSSIEKVREIVSIEEVVGKYVSLRRAGSRYTGLCPFHEENTPSFSINPTLGLWYCFGCSQGGDTIKFVQKLHNLDFTQSVELLASTYGVTLEYEEQNQGQTRNERVDKSLLIQIHNDAAKYYEEQLYQRKPPDALDFLDSRKLSLEETQPFQLGYSPSSGYGLSNHLKNKGYTIKQILSSALVREGNRGLYDYFRGRLMFAIKDQLGNTIAFGARRLVEDKNSPKYLNSPVTPIYDKSNCLYAIDRAAKNIRERSQAIIVEGYTDALALHLSGVDYALATCGTAFTEQHLRRVRRLLGDSYDSTKQIEFARIREKSPELVFMFDSDQAGLAATYRIFSLQNNFNGKISICSCPDGKDPCEYRLHHGSDELKTLIETKRLSLFTFLLAELLSSADLSNAQERNKALESALELLYTIQDPGILSQYLLELGAVFSQDENTLRTKLATLKTTRRNPSQVKFKENNPSGRRKHEKLNEIRVEDEVSDQADKTARQNSSTVYLNLVRQNRLEVNIVASIIQFPEYVSNLVLTGLGKDSFDNAHLRQIFSYLYSKGGMKKYRKLLQDCNNEVESSKQDWIEYLYLDIPTEIEELFTYLANYSLDLEFSGLIDEFDKEKFAHHLQGLYYQLERKKLTRKYRELHSQFGFYSINSAQGKKIGEEMTRIQNQLRSLKQKKVN